MNEYEAKKYLNRYSYIDVCIEIAKYSIHKDMELAKYYRGKSIKIKEDIITNKQKIQKLVKEKNKIKKSIEVLKPTYKEVLKLRYFENLNFYEIAEKMSYEYKSILNLHGKALKEFAKLSLQPVFNKYK